MGESQSPINQESRFEQIDSANRSYTEDYVVRRCNAYTVWRSLTVPEPAMTIGREWLAEVAGLSWVVSGVGNGRLASFPPPT